MKIQYYFFMFIVAILMVISWYISNQFTTRKFESKIVELNKLHNQETIEQQTKLIKGKADYESQITQIAKKYQSLIDSLKSRVDLSYQSPEKNEEYDQLVNEFVEFVPDVIPETAMITQQIVNSISLIDSCEYAYSDKNNGYSVDFDVTYDSESGLFKISPRDIVFAAQKSKQAKKTAITALWLGDRNGMGLVQYDLFPFLGVSGGLGIINQQFMPGVGLSYRF